MNCPRCEEQVLDQESMLGIDVDRCPGCHGVWLDRGEGEMVTRPDDLPPEVVARIGSLSASQVVERDDSPPLPCPRCHTSMQRELYAESSVEIDRCACGVWLDDGELEKITLYRQSCMQQLSRRGEEASGEGDEGLDLSFSPAALERAFARIYFDVGKEPDPQER